MTTTQTQLDLFTHAYLLAALWTFDDDAPSGDYETSGRPEELFPRFSREAIERAQADCAKFQTANGNWIARAELSDARAGHCFWLSRNGHGSGFFDEYSQSECDNYEIEQKAAILSRDFSKRDSLVTTCPCRYHACQRLQRVAREFGSCDLYAGDDGKFYFA